MAKNTDVALVEESKPSYLVALEEQGKVKSNDNFDSTDVVIPRIKLLQGTSPEIEAFSDAKPGIFWHTGFDIPLGNKVRFVVASRNKKMLLVAPLHDGQGILARSDNAKTWDTTGKWEVSLDPKKPKDTVIWEIDDLDVENSSVTKWGSSDPSNPDSPPAATMFYDYLAILPDHLDLGPAVLSLARSQIKRGKKGLNDKISLHQEAGRPMQALVFEASVTSESSVSGSYFNMQFRQVGFASEGVYHKAKSLSDVMKTYRVADEAGAASEGDTPKADSDAF